MRPYHPLPALALLAALLAPSAPPVLETPTGNPVAAVERIVVNDFGVNDRAYGLTETPYVRRDVTTKVRIYKHLIDLVPANQVSVVGGGTISFITRGVADNIGFLEVSLLVPAGQAPGSTITLKVGLLDQFPLHVVHRGEITATSQQPAPSTIQAGTPFTLTLTGEDLGGMHLASGSPTCHSVVGITNTATTKAFRLIRAATCTATNFSVLVSGTDNDDPDRYLRPNGAPFGHSFAYAPPPPEGLVCTSSPNLGLPAITSPKPGQQLVFAAATVSPVSVEVRWDSLTASGQPAPNNEWIVTAGSNAVLGTPQAATLPGGGQLIVSARNVSRTVTGLRTTFSLALPDTVTVTVRPKNCDQSAPASSVTFGLLRQ